MKITIFKKERRKKIDSELVGRLFRDKFGGVYVLCEIPHKNRFIAQRIGFRITWLGEQPSVRSAISGLVLIEERIIIDP